MVSSSLSSLSEALSWVNWKTSSPFARRLLTTLSASFSVGLLALTVGGHLLRLDGELLPPDPLPSLLDVCPQLVV